MSTQDALEEEALAKVVAAFSLVLLVVALPPASFGAPQPVAEQVLPRGITTPQGDVTAFVAELKAELLRPPPTPRCTPGSWTCRAASAPTTRTQPRSPLTWSTTLASWLAGLAGWQPQRDSNPCLHLERVVSLASRRWGRAAAAGAYQPLGVGLYRPEQHERTAHEGLGSSTARHGRGRWSPGRDAPRCAPAANANAVTIARPALAGRELVVRRGRALMSSTRS